MNGCVICGEPVRARGWCNAHYRRWMRHGDPEGGRTAEGEPMRWIEELAVETGKRSDPCRDWPFASPGKQGYPFAWGTGGKAKRVSHLILALSGRPRPPAPKDCALHSCRRPICCAPWHLRWGTKADNSADAIAHGTTAYKGPAGYGEKHAGSVLTTPEVLEIRRRWREDSATYPELQEDFGVGHSTLVAIIQGRTWKHLLGPDDVIHVPTPRLTDEEVAEIRSRVEGGESIKAVADAMGYRYMRVYDVVRRRHWKPV